ncbi:MAG: hypothetical protein WC052_05155 [Patescibacteria group bacterium]
MEPAFELTPERAAAIAFLVLMTDQEPGEYHPDYIIEKQRDMFGAGYGAVTFLDGSNQERFLIYCAIKLVDIPEEQMKFIDPTLIALYEELKAKIKEKLAAVPAAVTPEAGL